MTERAYLREFVAQAKKAGIYTEKIGDTYGGHRKSYDGYIVHRGHFIAFEAKNRDEPLKDHQREALARAHKAGEAVCYTARFFGRDVHFFPVFWGQEHPTGKVIQVWEKGLYTDLDELPEKLIKNYKKIRG